MLIDVASKWPVHGHAYKIIVGRFSFPEDKKALYLQLDAIRKIIFLSIASF